MPSENEAHKSWDSLGGGEAALLKNTYYHNVIWRKR